MKVLLLDSIDNPERGLRLAADSAWRPDRRPLFVPEGAGSVALEPRTALRIGRLGKCIAPRHAARYIDAVALAMVRADLDGAFILADDAIVLGPWQPLGTLPLQTDLDDLPLHLDFSPDAVAAALATLSCGVTFKTGDVLLLPPAAPAAAYTAPSTIQAAGPAGQLISFNIR